MESDLNRLINEQGRLLVDALKQGHEIKFRALGGSMSPLIPHGSLVTIAPCRAEDLYRGDVALCLMPSESETQDTWVLHRLISHDHQRHILYTAGDRLSVIDEPRRDVQVAGVLSKVILVPLKTNDRVNRLIYVLIFPILRVCAYNPRSLFSRLVGLTSSYLQSLRKSTLS